MVTEITREELKQKLDHPKRSVLLDALPPESYRQAHLPGALNMPADQVRTLASELIPRKDREVIVYCAGPTCHASERAAHGWQKWVIPMCGTMQAAKMTGWKRGSRL